MPTKIYYVYLYSLTNLFNAERAENKPERAGLVAVSCLTSGYIWILVSNWNEIECNLFNINSKPYFQKSLLARINVLWQALRLCHLNQNLLKGSAEKKVIISKELGPQKDTAM